MRQLPTHQIVVRRLSCKTVLAATKSPVLPNFFFSLSQFYFPVHAMNDVDSEQAALHSVANVHQDVQHTRVHHSIHATYDQGEHLTNASWARPKSHTQRNLVRERPLLRSQYEYNMLITVPFPIQEHPAMLSPKPPQKYPPRGTRPRSNAGN